MDRLEHLFGFPLKLSPCQILSLQLSTWRFYGSTIAKGLCTRNIHVRWHTDVCWHHIWSDVNVSFWWFSVIDSVNSLLSGLSPSSSMYICSCWIIWCMMISFPCKDLSDHVHTTRHCILTRLDMDDLFSNGMVACSYLHPGIMTKRSTHAFKRVMLTVSDTTGGEVLYE